MEWLKPPKGNRELEDERLFEKIRTSLERSRDAYGCPRIHRDLVASGET